MPRARRNALILAAVPLLVAGTLALAAPAPRVRTPVAGAGKTSGLLPMSGGSGASTSRSAVRDLTSACGTRLEASVELVARHEQRGVLSPLPTPHSIDVDDIAVLEDDGTFFYTGTNGFVVADLAAIGQSFYRTHGDDYDCLAVFLSTGLPTWLGSYSALAAAFVLRNDVQGIGIDSFDIGSNMGSASRLQWMLSMNGLHKYTYDPTVDAHGDSFTTLDVLAHEFGHRWLSYPYVDSAGTPSPALLGRQQAHWSFFMNSHASEMEGCEWVEPVPDSFYVEALTERYSDLDLYLMGAKPAAEVDSFFTLHDATDFNPPGTYLPETWPPLGTSMDARKHWWQLSDIVALNGPRVPDAANAPHHFRLGLILVTARGQDATVPDIEKVARIRTYFLPYFAGITQGLVTVDMTIDSRAGSVRIAHEPVKDHLDAETPIPVTARIDIDPGGIPIALDPASLTLFWRAGTSGPFASVPLTAAAGPDSFTASIPASPGLSGPVQYYLHAASDSSGIEADDPPAGAAAPHTFFVGPDNTPPVIGFTPIVGRSESQMPVTLVARITDNVAVDSAWVEWNLSGDPPQSTPFTVAGHDSFEVAIGAGATEGQTLSYQLVAVDGSSNFTIHHSQIQGGTPWAFVVGRDAWFDADNGDGGMTHEAGTTNYRDAWHLTTEDASPAGGTAWKCGAAAPLAYPTHLDANLVTPWIPVVDPGTTLRFDHRFALEEANASLAWDGALVEGQVGAGPWQVLSPEVPYSHAFFVNAPPFTPGTGCWSGFSEGWRSENVDLSPLAPGPARVRFRMLADDFFGYDGWIVDAIRVDRPGGVGAVSATAALDSHAWPNPATERIYRSVALPRGGDVRWELFDLAGRRVATLVDARLGAGPAVLEGRLPGGLRAGVYLSRLSAPGSTARTERIAILR